MKISGRDDEKPAGGERFPPAKFTNVVSACSSVPADIAMFLGRLPVNPLPLLQAVYHHLKWNGGSIDDHMCRRLLWTVLAIDHGPDGVVDLDRLRRSWEPMQQEDDDAWTPEYVTVRALTRLSRIPATRLIYPLVNWAFGMHGELDLSEEWLLLEHAYYVEGRTYELPTFTTS